MAKTQGLQFRPKLISVAVASCFLASTAFANPTGHTVVQGTVNIQQLGNLLKITNSPNAIINWQSFSIGANEITRFIQQSQSSAVLNRVTGTAAGIDPSVILGALQSNGRVFLINPSGIMFGAGAQVDVAGLVASSLNLSNADFLAKRLKFTDVAGAGSVVNQGNLSTGTGGGVYLIGSAVTNNGIITTPKGEVVLAAGKSVELVNPGTPSLRVEITAPDNQAVNLGTIVAEAGRVGIYAGLINNSGTISASSAVAKGGKILLTATKEVTLESTSILDASGVGGGRIDVLSKNGGTVRVNGRLDASAPTGGNGGFIDTSADVVKVADGTIITTAAPKGKTGMWLVDPQDFTIAAGYGGDISGSTLATALLSTNVTKTSDMGAYGGSYGGNIYVNDSVSWNSGNSLTLIAREDIFVNSSISNGGNGGVNLYAGWNGVSTSSPVVAGGTGDIQLMAPISTLGNVQLIASGRAYQSAGYGGAINANGLRIDSLGGSADFSQSTNMVNIVSGKSVQGFDFLNGKTLTVGSTGGRSGIEVISPAGPASVNIEVSSGSSADLNVNSNITATGGPSYGGYISLGLSASYGGTVSINNVSLIASGASGAYGGSSNIYISGPAVSISDSAVKSIGSTGSVYSGSGNISIHGSSSTGNSLAISGSTIEATGGGSGAAQSSADISLSSNGNILISGSTIKATGYEATIDIYANNSYGGNIQINSSTVTSTARTGADGAEGSVNVNAFGTVNTGSSTLKAVGRSQADGAEGGGSGVGIFANGNVTLGFLTSNDYVSVFSQSGSIIDGNSGANVSAPVAMLLGQAGGVGTVANPLETAVSQLFVAAYGGEIGVINSGSMMLAGLTNSGSGASAVEATGTLLVGGPVTTGGNLSLVGNNGILVQPTESILMPIAVAPSGISAGGDLVLNAGIGDLGIDGVNVFGQNVKLSGNNVHIGFTTSTAPTVVSASNLMKVTTAGNLNVLGGANSGASAILAGTDVDLSIGSVAGFVNINGGTNGAYAQIHAGSPQTITLFFPTLGAGGYFINGVEGAISDGSTGFFANGSPAVLGDSLKVTYGGAALPPPVQQGVNQNIEATNDPTKEPETNNTAVGSTGDGKETKELPVCK